MPTAIEQLLRDRAALDPAWDAVLAVYLAGQAEWPDPFTMKPPTR